MVAAEIGEGARRQDEAIEAHLLEAVRGGLQRQMGDAFIGKFGHQGLQPHRIGRGVVRCPFASGCDHADGPHAGRLIAELAPDLAHEGNHRGLAVGSGHRHYRLRLAAKKARRHKASVLPPDAFIRRLNQISFSSKKSSVPEPPQTDQELEKWLDAFDLEDEIEIPPRRGGPFSLPRKKKTVSPPENPKSSHKTKPHEHKVGDLNIEEWMEWFGFDKETEEDLE